VKIDQIWCGRLSPFDCAATFHTVLSAKTQNFLLLNPSDIISPDSASFAFSFNIIRTATSLLFPLPEESKATVDEKEFRFQIVWSFNVKDKMHHVLQTWY